MKNKFNLDVYPIYDKEIKDIILTISFKYFRFDLDFYQAIELIRQIAQVCNVNEQEILKNKPIKSLEIIHQTLIKIIKVLNDFNSYIEERLNYEKYKI